MPGCFCCADSFCDYTHWANRTGSNINSTQDWIQSCDPAGLGGSACSRCDWWPSRSSAPWYYNTADTPLTCGAFFRNNGSSYPCSQQRNYVNDVGAAGTTSPTFAKCCTFQPTCGLAYTNGSTWASNCLSYGMMYNASAANELVTGDPLQTKQKCCQPFIATCAMASLAGAPHQCPGNGTYLLINPSSTTVNDQTCCQFVPTCGFAYTDGNAWKCSVGTDVLNSAAQNATPPNDATCCSPTVSVSTSAFCFDNSTTPSGPAWPGESCSDGVCCYTPTCGRVYWYNATTNTITNTSVYSCPPVYKYNDSVTNVNDTSVDACCFLPTCGRYTADGTAYSCPAGYASVGGTTNATFIDVLSCCVSR